MNDDNEIVRKGFNALKQFLEDKKKIVRMKKLKLRMRMGILIFSK